jgi:hypothetical protein
MLWRRSSAQEQLEVSTIAEIARVVSLLSVPDNMIKGDG